MILLEAERESLLLRKADGVKAWGKSGAMGLAGAGGENSAIPPSHQGAVKTNEADLKSCLSQFPPLLLSYRNTHGQTEFRKTHNCHFAF